MTSFRNLDQTTGRIISLDGIDYLFFGGTAYLGLLSNPEYIELYKSGIDKYGLNNGTSRTNNVQLGIYDEVESHLAERFGFQSSALLSSGYLAAQVVVRSLKANRTLLYAPGSHPALWLDQSPIVTEIDFETWSKNTVEFINNAIETDFIVVSNCIDNLTPQRYDFSIFKNVNPNKNLLLVLDDSHGIGVLHKNKISTDLENLRKANIEIVVLASLAKGMGTDAGVVLGSNEIIAQIKKNPIFNGASPTSPAALYALIKGEKIYAEAFDRMKENTQLLAKLTSETNLSHIPDFPVFSSTKPFLYRNLLNHNILISSFPYPLATSPLLNRIVISALHTENDVRHLSEILCSEKSLIL